MSRVSAIAMCQFNPRRFVDPRSAMVRAPVAVSACLVGERVRYDGADKLLAATALLDQALQLTPICPEVGAGFSVPRPPVQLVVTDAGTRAQGRDDTALDATAALTNFAQLSTQRFYREQSLCGYLWKSRSPSCGFGSTPLFNPSGQQVGLGNGIQADYFQRLLPWLHYREESDLSDDDAVAVFVLRCRLIFDLLHTAPDDLPGAHRHYRFLWRQLLAESRELLEELCGSGSITNYLVALNSACNQINHTELLELFRK